MGRDGNALLTAPHRLVSEAWLALDWVRNDSSGPGPQDFGGSLRLRDGLADESVRSITSAGLPNKVCCLDSLFPLPLVFDRDMGWFFVPTTFRLVKHISHWLADWSAFSKVQALHIHISVIVVTLLNLVVLLQLYSKMFPVHCNNNTRARLVDETGGSKGVPWMMA